MNLRAACQINKLSLIEVAVTVITTKFIKNVRLSN